ncbi:maleylpyruvate isomerase family mycothiol-dependent enzyme [Actinomadura sp. KC06]|uniref:maleylpyruvate isomerase family mycothiol-dependent enzyme n=1 Tax=Actinomadura sp. KC06 TaxID=2530369 RepID=UPI00104B2EC6|nr:maleylpyruvate isomerase family mycothiol-dependent enzyme [Actinomadura sp. KC06]TDD35504.1 maleylpyruvate isomerase family mycothiol-dependent enzyme [Actinomadura sp. KC06]
MGEWEPAPNHLVYERVRNNVIGLLEERPDAAGLPVPACPEWTVLDLVGHLLDICGLATRRLTGDGPDGKPRAVPPPGDAPRLARLLWEWRESGARLDDLIAAQLNPSTNVLVMDAFTHELDLREALGEPLEEAAVGAVADALVDAHPAYPGVLGVVVGGFSGEVRKRGLPALEITTPGARWSAGVDRPSATLTVPSPHDLLRSLTGRRTVEQIAALGWSADPAPWLPAFAWGPFTPPERPVEKAAGSMRAG